MFALVLQVPNENRTDFSIVLLYKRPRTENTACAKRVRPFAKIRTGESKSKLACILPRGRSSTKSKIVKFFNKRSRLSDLGIPLHTGIKPFPFKLCIEKHRTAETLKPETRNFRPIRKQLLSRKKIASSQKNTCLCIGSGSGTAASVLRPDASFPEPTRRAPAVRKRNPGQRPPREKRQTSPELAPQSNRSCDGGGK